MRKEERERGECESERVSESLKGREGGKEHYFTHTLHTCTHTHIHTHIHTHTHTHTLSLSLSLSLSQVGDHCWSSAEMMCTMSCPIKFVCPFSFCWRQAATKQPQNNERANP